MTDYIYDGKYAPKDFMPATNPLKIVSAGEHHGEYTAIATAVNSKLNINNPAFTGTMTGANINITGSIEALGTGGTVAGIDGGTW